MLGSVWHLVKVSSGVNQTSFLPHFSEQNNLSSQVFLQTSNLIYLTLMVMKWGKCG